jgi:hypothetical protein
LAGPFPWYKSVAGATDITEEAPGAFYVLGTASETFVLEYNGVFEFSGSVSTSNTPAVLALREEIKALRVRAELAREKARIMSVLAPPDIVPKK